MDDSSFITHNVIEPKGIVQVYRDFWWWCLDGDPSRALFYRPRKRGCGSPQCNSSEAVVRKVGEGLGHDKRAKLIQIPLAFVPWEE